jgi:hypothetical protein
MTAYPRINVQAFGAKGDGISDDSAAIQAAVNAAFNARNGFILAGSQSVFSYLPVIFFPAGNYLITTQGCFNPSALTPYPGCSIAGLTFIGEAYGGTQITFNNNGLGWLFDDQDIASQTNFKNLQFQGKTGKESGLRFACTNDAGRVYSSCFEDCDFTNFAQALRFDGSFDTSENKFHRVSFCTAASQTAITINNEQAVNFWMDDITALGVGTTINLIQGGFISVRNLNLVLNGGVFIETQPPNTGIGQNNDGLFVQNARCELYGAQFASINNGMHLTIQNSNFNPVNPLSGPASAGTAQLVATNGSTIKVMNTILSGNVATYADSKSVIAVTP